MVEICVMLFIVIIQIIYYSKKVFGVFFVFFKLGFYIFRSILLYNLFIQFLVFMNLFFFLKNFKMFYKESGRDKCDNGRVNN